MPTYTDLVILQDWLEIESVSFTQVNRVQIPILNGWIYTTDQAGLEDYFDERHPVLITGRPAEAILEINRKIHDKLSGAAGFGLIDVLLNGSQMTQVLTN